MKQAAGILVYRLSGPAVEVLLVHLGGPLWGHKDTWSIPKGELEDGEDHLAAAQREFLEEMGSSAPQGELIDLGTSKTSTKINQIWAVEGDFDVKSFSSNKFTMEWPPKSGNIQEFPENDRAAWFQTEVAKKKVFSYLTVHIDRLVEKLGRPVAATPEQQHLL